MLSFWDTLAVPRIGNLITMLPILWIRLNFVLKDPVLIKTWDEIVMLTNKIVFLFLQALTVGVNPLQRH